MDRWTQRVPSLTTTMIQVAVKDEKWQVFRTYLKGLVTAYKLDLLQELGNLENVPKESSPLWDEQLLREWRVANYINALRRGGQLNSNNEVVR